MYMVDNEVKKLYYKLMDDLKNYKYFSKLESDNKVLYNGQEISINNEVKAILRYLESNGLYTENDRMIQIEDLRDLELFLKHKKNDVNESLSLLNKFNDVCKSLESQKYVRDLKQIVNIFMKNDVEVKEIQIKENPNLISYLDKILNILALSASTVDYNKINSVINDFKMDISRKDKLDIIVNLLSSYVNSSSFDFKVKYDLNILINDLKKVSSNTNISISMDDIKKIMQKYKLLDSFDILLTELHLENNSRLIVNNHFYDLIKQKQESNPYDENKFQKLSALNDEINQQMSQKNISPGNLDYLNNEVKIINYCQHTIDDLNKSINKSDSSSIMLQNYDFSMLLDIAKHEKEILAFHLLQTKNEISSISSISNSLESSEYINLIGESYVEMIKKFCLIKKASMLGKKQNSMLSDYRNNMNQIVDVSGEINTFVVQLNNFLTNVINYFNTSIKDFIRYDQDVTDKIEELQNNHDNNGKFKFLSSIKVKLNLKSLEKKRSQLKLQRTEYIKNAMIEAITFGGLNSEKSKINDFIKQNSNEIISLVESSHKKR